MGLLLFFVGGWGVLGRHFGGCFGDLPGFKKSGPGLLGAKSNSTLSPTPSTLNRWP